MSVARESHSGNTKLCCEQTETMPVYSSTESKDFSKAAKAKILTSGNTTEEYDKILASKLFPSTDF